MLIPKNVTKLPVDNPFRPKIGIPVKHTICKLSWGNFDLEQDAVEQRIKVDADHIDEFADFMDTIPREECHRCGVHDVWLVDRKWKKHLLERAKKCFDETKTELRNWK